MVDRGPREQTEHECSYVLVGGSVLLCTRGIRCHGALRDRQRQRERELVRGGTEEGVRQAVDEQRAHAVVRSEFERISEKYKRAPLRMHVQGARTERLARMHARTAMTMTTTTTNALCGSEQAHTHSPLANMLIYPAPPSESPPRKSDRESIYNKKKIKQTNENAHACIHARMPTMQRRACRAGERASEREMELCNS